MVQHRLHLFCFLEASADPHNIPTGKFRESILDDGIQRIFTLLDQIVGAHQGVSGTSVFGKVSTDCNSTGHLLQGNYGRFRDIQEISALGIGSSSQQTGNPQHSAYQLTGPIRDVRILILQLGLYFTGESL